MSIKYRSDIDGLRAIAVLFVVIFHSYDNLIPSGFIGVDIFFVISGFLISSIIKQQLIDKNFSFPDFYRRRLWRLQPALLLVMLFVLVITSIFYLPDDYIDVMNSEKYTSLFLSNQYFSRVTTSYSAQDSVYLPLLHTWSLAIEWQWYLLMPPALFLLHTLCRRYHFSIVRVVSLLTILTVILSLFLSDNYPDKSYYLFSSRIFEFMIGVTIAYIPEKINHKNQSVIYYQFPLLSY
ncbi:acyltransferase family protein [Morganella morganii]|uniref:acyltransferase family protein n=1 Tax=Morganella morganii TaxID=582 RepID=UPI0032D9C492